MSRFIKIIGAVTVLNILASLFGFARELTIGYQYGTSFQADSIITAFTIPNFLYVVIGGAVTTAFISVYSKLNTSVKNVFVQTLFTYLSLFIGIVTVLFMLFPRFWIELFFSGMSEEGLILTSKLFLVTAPATFFLVVSMLFSGLNNVHGNYRLSTFTSLIFNGTYFFIGFGLTPIIMEYSYALGATLGSLFMFLILVYQIKKQRLMPLRFTMKKLPEKKRFLNLAMPLIIGGATLQFYLIIQRIFAAGLNDGAIASINYASKMTQFPQGVLMASITTVIYPLLAKAAGEGDFSKIKKAYQDGFRLLTLILLPASIFFFIYAKEIITFIFQYGNFSEESTNITYPLLQVFSLSIFSFALNTYVTRFFYALENTLLPNILNIISVFGINIAVVLLFIDKYGAGAIAFGTVISTIVNMVLLIVFAKTKLNLTICNWRYLVKLLCFIVIVTGVLWISAQIPMLVTFISLCIGGIFTLLLVGIGMKFIK